MTIETKVMDTIFDIVILTQLVHSEPILNLNKVLFKTNRESVGVNNFSAWLSAIIIEKFKRKQSQR